MELIGETELPKVIQNSDYLYKSNVEWFKDIEYCEPNEFEKNMLKNTKTPQELLEEEAKEVIVLQTEEEKKKNILTIIKVVCANRLGFSPLVNVSTLQPKQIESFKGMMECLISDYNCGLGDDVTKEFNNICNEKLFHCGADVSSYPVYS
jgi:hypothetical protein